jgi:Ca2+-transporting ATPase
VVLEAEAEEPTAMRRPPRARNSALLPRRILIWCLTQGVVAFAAVAAVFLLAWLVHLERSPDFVRTEVFLALVGVNLALVFVNRTFSASLRAALGRPNRMLWLGLGIAVAVLATILALPGARGFFGLDGVGLAGLGVGFAAWAATLLMLQLAKRLWGAALES